MISSFWDLRIYPSTSDDFIRKKKPNPKLKKIILKKSSISRSWLASSQKQDFSRVKASFPRRLSVKPRVLLPPKFRSFVMVSQYPWNGKSILERFTNALESGIEGEKCLWGNVIDTCASIGKAQERRQRCNTWKVVRSVASWKSGGRLIELKTRAKMNPRRGSNVRKIRSIVAWGRVRTVDSDRPRARERSQRAGLPTLAPLSRGPHHAMHTLGSDRCARSVSKGTGEIVPRSERSLMVCPLETCVEMLKWWIGDPLLLFLFFSFSLLDFK